MSTRFSASAPVTSRSMASRATRSPATACSASGTHKRCTRAGLPTRRTTGGSRRSREFGSWRQVAGQNEVDHVHVAASVQEYAYPATGRPMVLKDGLELRVPRVRHDPVRPRPPRPARVRPARRGADTVTPDRRRRILRSAVLIRRVEERLLELFAGGELSGTVHTSLGQELCSAVVADHLGPADMVFSNHRCHGHYLAVTCDVPGLVAEVMGRQSGVSHGRGGSQHLHAANFLSTGVQGGCVPISAGVALAKRTTGEDGIAVCFVGDGTFGQGVVYEVLNLASLWRLPVLFVVEDNGYAQSTPKRSALAGTVAARAEAFEVEHACGDIWNWEALWTTAGDAVRHVRSGAGPFLLEVRTYRLGAHSKGDDDRDPAEVARFWAKDPLNVLVDASDPDVAAVVPEVTAVVDWAVAHAAASPVTRRQPDELAEDTPVAWRPARPASGRFVVALRSALTDLLRDRPDAHLIGQDILSPYGGAFKVTDGLSVRHPDRVHGTPISEAAIVGVGTGLALWGRLPLVEIMFGDFVTLATDQLVNQAAKLRFLKGPGGDPIDLVVRTPMGGGRGYGPTHSQSLEKLFFGVPGLRVVAFNDLVPPDAVVGAIGSGGIGPTVLIENKLLYGRTLGDGIPAGFDLALSDERFPTAWLRTDRDPDVTLLGYGGVCYALLVACERLFLEYDLFAQVLCPTQVYPMWVNRFRAVLERAPALVVVEEGHGFAGFGAEVLAQLAEWEGPVRPVVRRVAAVEDCIPASRDAERATLPDVEDVVTAALKAMDARVR